MERILFFKENISCFDKYQKTFGNAKLNYSVLLYRLSMIVDEYNTLMNMAKNNLCNTLTFNCVQNSLIMEITTVFDVKSKGYMIVELWNDSFAIVPNQNIKNEKVYGSLLKIIEKYYFVENYEIKIPQNHKAKAEEKYKNYELISLFKIRNSMIAHNNDQQKTIDRFSAINNTIAFNRICEDIKIVFEILFNIALNIPESEKREE